MGSQGGSGGEGAIVEVRDGPTTVLTVKDGDGLVDDSPARGIVQVGSIVLLRIATSTHRPLLVHTINHDGTIAGELFLNWEEDMKAAWVREHAFYPPASDSRTMAVKRARRGTGVGEWEPFR